MIPIEIAGFRWNGGRYETLFPQEEFLRGREGQVEDPADIRPGQLLSGNDGVDQDGYRQGHIQIHEDRCR